MSTTTTVNGLTIITPNPTATGGALINDNFTTIGTRLNALENPPALLQTSGIQGPTGAEVLLTNNEDITAVIVQGTGNTTCSMQVNGAVICQSLTVGNGNAGIEGSVIVNQHLGSNGSTPTIAGGSGAGTTGTVTCSGTDLIGSITLIPTGTITTNAVVATLTFATPYNNESMAMLSPANLTAANYVGAYLTSSVNAVTLHSGTTTFTQSATYVWNYATYGN